MSVLDTVASITQIAGVPLTLLALGFAVIQIKKADQQLEKAAETARAQILLALDESLSSFEDIRQELNKSQPHITDDKKVTLRRYIAAFERVGYALKVGEISIALVTYFFGGRFKALADHIRQDRYAQDIVKNKEAWKYFYFLWKELKLPEPP